MTFNEFCYEANKMSHRHPEWRMGQTYFNVLYLHRPDLSEQIRATPLDPFYVDSRIETFLAWVGENW